jgi:hypothetical protein
MKRFILLILLSVYATEGFGQLIGIYGGGGLATKNNFDVSPSYGLSYNKAIGRQTWIGFNIFSQGYRLYYDNEMNSAKRELGATGFTLHHKSSYVFFAPKFIHELGQSGLIEFYVNGGVGSLMSGYDSVRKWDHRFSSTSPQYYDSIIDASANVNKMVYRIGLGFTEYIKLRGRVWFTITEDFGFLASSLTKTADINHQSPSRTPYSPQKMSPAYVSLQLGFSWVRRRK